MLSSSETRLSPAKGVPELTSMPSMTANIDKPPDITYFQFCCHLIIKNLFTSYSPSIKVDVA